jgi:hypothetical protein
VSGVSEPALATFGLGELADHGEAAVGHGLHNQLGNAISPADHCLAVGVGVDQQYLDLSPVSSVDETWGVEARDTMAHSKATAGLHEACEPFGNCQGNACGHQGPSSTGLQHHTRHRPKIQSGVTGPRIRGEIEIFIKLNDRDGNRQMRS